MTLHLAFLPGVDDFKIGNANIVIAAIFLDVDSVLGHQGSVLPTVILGPEDGCEAGEVATIAIRKLNNELGL